MRALALDGALSRWLRPTRPAWTEMNSRRKGALHAYHSRHRL
ncbi:hypothetical protein COLINT_02926 [Collinsella intestinalis DSM 13280]|uniref:Uncharacterized protein n=1 Tax=Collinsella intestinalis DSM 13280 TaxID=521003 RepID=C4FA34_9ACTN|nr:hypothetical protein COLINT_02926 [Collinsella intestinalis DSM 13280]